MTFPDCIANYALIRPLGSGVSGATWEARNIYDMSGHTVALKIQDRDIEYPTNCRERAIYPLLQGGIGMPRLWTAGVQGKYDYLAIDLLGNSLDKIYRENGKATMDMRTVCSIAVQLITRLEFMHLRGVLHRDIQLGNIALGLKPNEKILYMIDFGFSTTYVDLRTRKHIANVKPDAFIGNYWFSSVNVHCRGKAASRRDDLEAAALLLIHLLTPNGLSWTRDGVPRDETAHARLKRQKRAALPEDICRGLPIEFEDFLRHCRRLTFAAKPDYAYCRDLFLDLAQESGCHDIESFIWPPSETIVKPPARARAHDSNAIEKVLQDLAGLKLENRPVLGDKKNVQVSHRQPKPNGLPKAAQPIKKPALDTTNVIVISDSSDIPPIARRYAKAEKLDKLTREASNAMDNNALARLVIEFVTLLKSNTSRTLTREGFAFLDALHKQLVDPSVFIVPLRTSRTKTGKTKASIDSAENTQPLQQGRERLNKLWQLRQGVGKAQDNKALAALVAEFGSLTDKTAGRNVTKDGFAFLEGMAERLKVVQ